MYFHKKLVDPVDLDGFAKHYHRLSSNEFSCSERDNGKVTGIFVRGKDGPVLAAGFVTNNRPPFRTLSYVDDPSVVKLQCSQERYVEITCLWADPSKKSLGLRIYFFFLMLTVFLRYPGKRLLAVTRRSYLWMKFYQKVGCSEEFCGKVRIGGQSFDGVIFSATLASAILAGPRYILTKYLLRTRNRNAKSTKGVSYASK